MPSPTFRYYHTGRAVIDKYVSSAFVSSGPAHDYRQKVMYTEGLLKPKLSAVIGVGKPEMSSFGVEDQFSHSNYTPKDPIKVCRFFTSQHIHRDLDICPGLCIDVFGPGGG